MLGWNTALQGPLSPQVAVQLDACPWARLCEWGEMLALVAATIPVFERTKSVAMDTETTTRFTACLSLRVALGRANDLATADGGISLPEPEVTMRQS